METIILTNTMIWILSHFVIHVQYEYFENSNYRQILYYKHSEYDNISWNLCQIW